MRPILLRIYEFPVFTYPLFLGMAIGIVYYYSLSVSQKRGIGRREFESFFWGNFIYAWLGAKIFYYFFSVRSLGFTSVITSSSFWVGGGFVFYGGLLGVIIFSSIYMIFLKKFSFDDFVAFLPGGVLAHGVGRFGCFLTGCCYGKETDLPWKVYMRGDFRHPVQLYEMVFLIGVFFVLRHFLKRKVKSFHILLSYLTMYAVGRFILEMWRGDFIRGIYFYGWSTSQLLSMAIMMFIILTIIYRLRRT